MPTFPTFSVPLSALSLTNSPSIESYYFSVDSHGNMYREVEVDYDVIQTPFNLALLREHQVNASQVTELADLILEKGFPNFPIVFCRLAAAWGQVMQDGTIPWPLVFIDIQRMNTLDELREVYLHEAAHLVVDDNDHDFSFAAINNLLRSYAGYPQSQREYDYRSCNVDDLSIVEAMSLSGALAQYVVNQRVPVLQAIQAISALINNNYHVAADSQTIVEKLKLILALDLDVTVNV